MCGSLRVGEASYQFHALSPIRGADRLPYSLKVLLENLLRNEDGRLVTAEQVESLAAWRPDAKPQREIHLTPARVLMQDFTGVPCVVDLVAMRDAVVRTQISLCRSNLDRTRALAAATGRMSVATSVLIEALLSAMIGDVAA